MSRRIGPLSLAVHFLVISTVSAAGYEDLGPEKWDPEPLAIEAAHSDPNLCLSIERFGCWFAPATIRQSNAPTLIVFFRGWRDNRERSNIPPGERVASSRQAFVQFGLEEVARAKNAALIVTGAPPSGVSMAQVARLEGALGLRFSRVVLASHSAGYQGLDATLKSGDLTQIGRIIMLDNFYMEGTLLESVAYWVGRGTGCNGFYTFDRRESVQRHQAAFKRVCRLEDHDDTGHFNTINKCLGAYYDGHACP